MSATFLGSAILQIQMPPNSTTFELQYIPVQTFKVHPEMGLSRKRCKHRVEIYQSPRISSFVPIAKSYDNILLQVNKGELQAPGEDGLVKAMAGSRQQLTSAQAVALGIVSHSEWIKENHTMQQVNEALIAVLSVPNIVYDCFIDMECSPLDLDLGLASLPVSDKDNTRLSSEHAKVHFEQEKFEYAAWLRKKNS